MNGNLKIDFEHAYTEIKNSAKSELNVLEKNIRDLFFDKTPLDKDLLEMLTAPAKRLRPLLAVLFLKFIQQPINHFQQNAMLAVELIHNASLIHDDVIDKAGKRRNQDTLNIKFDDNLAVVAGDFLLSVAMEKIVETNSIEVLNVFASCLKITCVGEINQYFCKYKVPTLEEYIQKSKEKTALLFKAGILGVLLLCEPKVDDELVKIATEFAENFGIAFQIRDDLINFLNSDSLANNDFQSGIYTAPVIFAYQEDKDLLDSENPLALIKDLKGIAKTKDLMDNYFYQAILVLEKIKSVEKKEEIFRLVEALKNNL